MSDVTEYQNLLIKQYWNKPKAKAEIAAMLEHYLSVSDVIDDWGDQFDIDQATGHRLDIIGAVVRYSRSRSEAIPVSLQGSTPSTLSDSAYRALLKVAIARNTYSDKMSNETKTSLQDAILLAFDGHAYVVDNYNLSLTLIIDDTVDEDLAIFVRDSGLLPKPATVRYSSILRVGTGNTFGFDEDPNAFPWDDKFSPVATAGVFAQKVF